MHVTGPPVALRLYGRDSDVIRECNAYVGLNPNLGRLVPLRPQMRLRSRMYRNSTVVCNKFVINAWCSSLSANNAPRNPKKQLVFEALNGNLRYRQRYEVGMDSEPARASLRWGEGGCVEFGLVCL